jgi:hypothetical protein
VSIYKTPNTHLRCAATCLQAYVVVGASTTGASSAFVLTTGEEEQPQPAAQPAVGAGEAPRYGMWHRTHTSVPHGVSQHQQHRS